MSQKTKLFALINSAGSVAIIYVSDHPAGSEENTSDALLRFVTSNILDNCNIKTIIEDWSDEWIHVSKRGMYDVYMGGE